MCIDYQDVDRFLGVYPLDDCLKKWLSLTSHLQSHVLQRLCPESGLIESASEMQGASGIVSQRSSNMDTSTDGQRPESEFLKQHKDFWKEMQPVESARIKFTIIPRRLIPQDATPQDVSKHSIDKTFTLKHILDQFNNSLKFN